MDSCELTSVVTVNRPGKVTDVAFDFNPGSSPIAESSKFSERSNGIIKRKHVLVDSFLYWKRIFKFKHMDFEFAMWEIACLFSWPQKVYRNVKYRKEHRGSYSREDPAFLVLLLAMLFLSSIGFSFVLGLSTSGVIKFIVWVTMIDGLMMALSTATFFYCFCNRILRSVDSEAVEWGYAFDIHLNGFLPMVMILHFIQLPFLYPVILKDWVVSRLFGNLFWVMGLLYYFYVTFLGYNLLSFLKRTEVFLYPMTVVVFLYFISIFTGWNFSKILFDFYRIWH